MIITHKKGLDLTGDTPTILYGYGGFNVSLTPRYSSSRAAWLEQGGVYAVANIRGGGEYGKAWHIAGTSSINKMCLMTLLLQQNISLKKLHTLGKLAIQGGSNGGLLVAAAMVQRPDLFAVALPAVIVGYVAIS